MSAPKSFREIRYLILLLILLFVAVNTWLVQKRSTDWEETLWAVIYPINADGNQQVQGYIDDLDEEDFAAVERFLRREARRYGLDIAQPVTMKLAPEVKEKPPTPPRDGNVLKTMAWSLKMRYWAYTRDNFQGPEPDIQIFVVYHDPQLHAKVDHSLGLQKGLLGVVNAYAHSKDRPRNNVVIAHELLHTLGASDKYDMHTNSPLFPIGYADPEQTPLYPQKRAEIMAGRIIISQSETRMPNSLREVILGPLTAREIRWIE